MVVRDVDHRRPELPVHASGSSCMCSRSMRSMRPTAVGSRIEGLKRWPGPEPCVLLPARQLL